MAYPMSQAVSTSRRTHGAGLPSTAPFDREHPAWDTVVLAAMSGDSRHHQPKQGCDKSRSGAAGSQLSASCKIRYVYIYMYILWTRCISQLGLANPMEQKEFQDVPGSHTQRLSVESYGWSTVGIVPLQKYSPMVLGMIRWFSMDDAQFHYC